MAKSSPQQWPNLLPKITPHLIRLATLLSLLANLIIAKSHAAVSKYVELDPSKRILLQNDSLIIGGVSFSRDGDQWHEHLASLCRDGEEVACLYDYTLERVKSTVNEIDMPSGDDGVSGNLARIEAIATITADLLLLGAFHRQHLDIMAAVAASFDYDVESTNIFASKHLSRALGSHHAALYYYTTLWNAYNADSQITIEEGMDEEMSLLAMLYDRHAISLAAFGAALQLSDLYEIYYPIYHQPQSTEFLEEEEITKVSREGYTLSYRYLLSCEFWCDNSQSLLESISSHRDNDTPGEEYASEQLLAEQHSIYVLETRQSLAHANVRVGTLLLTMYAEGYTLTPDEMLSYHAVARSVLLKSYGYDVIGENNAEDYSQEIVDKIKSDQERLLLRIVERIKTGIAMYQEIEEFGDNRINLADSRHHLGVAYQYLGDYKSGIVEWRTSLDLYRSIFDEYGSPSSSSMDVVDSTSVADIAASLITTSQQCGDALLTLGQYDETKEMYQLNLKFRRYLDDGTWIEEDLDRDGEDAEADFDESGWDNPQYGQFPSFSTRDIDESIHQHKVLLDEYYQMLQNNPAGSYHEVAFGADGSQVSSITTTDKMYEGSLRSVIGSLYLAKNEVRAARDELELAVAALRRGMEDEASGIWDTPAKDAEGNELSVPLYLADALLNLSYAQCGMKQWQKSMASFEDALDIFKKELTQGESPFDYKKNGSGNNNSNEPVQRDNLVERLKSRFSIKVENYDIKSNSTTKGSEELKE